MRYIALKCPSPLKRLLGKQKTSCRSQNSGCFVIFDEYKKTGLLYGLSFKRTYNYPLYIRHTMYLSVCVAPQVLWQSHHLEYYTMYPLGWHFYIFNTFEDCFWYLSLFMPEQNLVDIHVCIIFSYYSLN